MDVKAILKKSGSIIGLIVLFVVISCLNSSFIDPSNLKNLLRQVSINALISFGMTFVILTGGIDLSVGSILALSSALMGSFIKGGMDPVFGIVLACHTRVGGNGELLRHDLAVFGSGVFFFGDFRAARPWKTACISKTA